MNDHFGRQLSEGERVLYKKTSFKHTTLYIGEVVGFTQKMVRISLGMKNDMENITLVSPTSLVSLEYISILPLGARI